MSALPRAATLLALALAACGHRPAEPRPPTRLPRPTEGIPEMRALVAIPGTPVGEAPPRAVREWGFNTVVLPVDMGGPPPPEERIGHRIREAHGEGLDVLLWPMFLSSPAEGAERRRQADAWLGGWQLPTGVDGIVLEGAGPEAVSALAARLEQGAPSARLIAATWGWEGAPTPDWRLFAEALVSADRAGAEASPEGVSSPLPPHLPRAARIQPADADAAARVIDNTRRSPLTGFVLLDSPGNLTANDMAALRAGPFAQPAFPPSRDWRVALRAALAQAASAEDLPALIAGGVASLRRALDAGEATDLETHQALDFLLSQGEEGTLAQRHLRFALLCLRQTLSAPRDQSSPLN